jgi:hypothetical protein
MIEGVKFRAVGRHPRVEEDVPGDILLIMPGYEMELRIVKLGHLGNGKKEFSPFPGKVTADEKDAGAMPLLLCARQRTPALEPFGDEYAGWYAKDFFGIDSVLFHQ